MICFSIIIPTYNRASVLSRALDSVLNQSYKDFEIIVVDDGSTDNTEQVIRTYTNAEVIYSRQVNKGVSAARNFGTSKTSGNYLIFIDSDDYLAPNALEYFYNGIVESKADLIHSGLKFIYQDGRSELKSPRDPYNTGKLTKTGIQLVGTFCLKTELFKRVGGYDEFLTYGENTELFWRLNNEIIQSHIIDEVTINVTRDSESRASTAPENIINSISYILGKHQSFLKINKNIHWLYLNNLGVAYQKSGKIKNALNSFLKALAIYPWRWKTYIRIVLSVVRYY